MSIIIQWVIVGIIIAVATVFLVKRLARSTKGGCSGCCEGCKMAGKCEPGTTEGMNEMRR
ncbi:MAG: FeoB-associated Cys-rich membrane protein [Armatimonadota bacterium]|nr:FeoB-associated Cys-rich membrane protein [bacterium]